MLRLHHDRGQSGHRGNIPRCRRFWCGVAGTHPRAGHARSRNGSSKNLLELLAALEGRKTLMRILLQQTTTGVIVEHICRSATAGKELAHNNPAPAWSLKSSASRM